MSTITYVLKIAQAYSRNTYSCIQLHVKQSADCILRMINYLMKVVKYLHKICEQTLFPNTVKLVLKLSLGIKGICLCRTPSTVPTTWNP